MKAKLIPIITAACISIMPTNQVYATEVNDNIMEETLDSINTVSMGLIFACTLSCSSDVKTFYFSALTDCTDTMAEVGIKNIKIQRSSDLINWTTEKTLSNQITEDFSIFYVEDYRVSVTGGYYYRVSLDHYAKENTWWFPDKETLHNTSNSVWVPRQ